MTERLIFHSTEQLSKNALTAELNGFSGKQEVMVKETMEDFGMPLVNISEVNYSPTEKGREEMVGSFRPHEGKMSYYKSIDKLPAPAQHAVMSHEIAHANSPFEAKNEQLYGSGEVAERARMHTITVAEQTIKSRTFLNGYQKELARQLQADEIDERRYLEETFAILVEQRFTNPKHLEQVQEALNAKVDNPVDVKGGTDLALVGLIDSVNSPQELDEHIRHVRTKVVKSKKPIFPNKSLPLAA